MPPLDQHARRQRIEKLLTMVEDLNTLDALPLPERFHQLSAWAEKHLSPAEQEWRYQPWQRALERYVEEPSDEPAPSLVFPSPRATLDTDHAGAQSQEKSGAVCTRGDRDA